MGGQPGAQQLNQPWVVELVPVGDAQHDEGLAGQLGPEFLPQNIGVAALHHKHHVGPAEVPGRYAHPRARLGTGRAGLVVRVLIKKPLGREAAPAVLTTDEEKLPGFGGKQIARVNGVGYFLRTSFCSDANNASRFFANLIKAGSLSTIVEKSGAWRWRSVA